MDGTSLRIEKTGELVELTEDVTTVGRGPGVHVSLQDASVSRLHAEIVRRGPYVYVADLGLSRNGTRVNGRPVGRRVLADGDVVRFGAAGVRVVENRARTCAQGPSAPETTVTPEPPEPAAATPARNWPPPAPTAVSVAPGEPAGAARATGPASYGDDRQTGVNAPTVDLHIANPPDLTRREWDVLRALCRPLTEPGAFVMPRSAREIARELVVTEGAVKQHLLRLYRKFGIPAGPNRRGRLANEAVRLGVVRPSNQPVAPRA